MRVWRNQGLRRPQERKGWRKFENFKLLQEVANKKTKYVFIGDNGSSEKVRVGARARGVGGVLARVAEDAAWARGCGWWRHAEVVSPLHRTWRRRR